MRTLVRWAGIGLTMLLAGCAGNTNANGDAAADATSTSASQSPGCGATWCDDNELSSFNVGGSIALPDADVNALSIAICLETYCVGAQATNDAGTDASVEPTLVVDGGVTTVRYFAGGNLGLGSCSFTQTGEGQYDMEASVSFDGGETIISGASGTMTITISSGGTTLYTNSTSATCSLSCNECNSGYVQSCTVQL